jgi:transposase InsO family protein
MIPRLGVEGIVPRRALPPRYLLRDRDAIYGDGFTRRIAGLGMREHLIAPRVPWQNPFAERLIGSLRREFLDYFHVFNERHLRRLLRAAYYNTVRPHRALHNDGPRPRAVHPPALGSIVAIPLVASRITATSALICSLKS